MLLGGSAESILYFRRDGQKRLVACVWVEIQKIGLNELELKLRTRENANKVVVIMPICNK